MTERVRERRSPAFYLAKDTFDTVPISVGTYPKLEAKSTEGTSEICRSVDEERCLLKRQFLAEFAEKLPVEQATFLVDGAAYLASALSRLGLQFQVCPDGNRNSIERVFREVKRRTSSFSNTFSHARQSTAETWLQAFAVWWNRC